MARSPAQAKGQLWSRANTSLDEATGRRSVARLVTEKRGHTVRLWSHNGIDVTTRYVVLLPEAVPLGLEDPFLPDEQAIDGERRRKKSAL
jgi:hypothetical protein